MTTATATPQELYGPLLAAVQEREILADGKTFVDAVPRRAIIDIMRDFTQLSDVDDATLARFVAANFDLPPSVEIAAPAEPRLPLRSYIRALWPSLARDPAEDLAQSSALPVRHRHLVPGGRFREIYYWDSFFSLLGLVRDEQAELARGIVDAMTDLIETHGHVPNGARTYYLGRSQPPLYHMMVALLDDRRGAVAGRRLEAMKREHGWWMDGAETLAPGKRSGHVARLADGALVNRYWDPRVTPRDESWREDVATAAGEQQKEQVYRDLRAGAESGWDFSSRWLSGRGLSSIRTTSIAPVDLNAFLFGLETAIAQRSTGEDAERYADFAEQRRRTLQNHFWDHVQGAFVDYDLDGERTRPRSSAAALTPLLVGAATQAQADATARFVRSHYLAPGGLRTTLVDSGEQWDRPNGWAPLQWIAVTGLRRYGHHDLAEEIATRWLAIVERTYERTGLLFEKYDIEANGAGGGGEYAPQTGFGWTNGVTADFIDGLRWSAEGTSCSQA